MFVIDVTNFLTKTFHFNEIPFLMLSFQLCIFYI